MALEVPALDVRLGLCGLSGRGGGARSGSEESHLSLVVRKQSDVREREGNLHWDQRPHAISRRPRMLMSEIGMPFPRDRTVPLIVSHWKWCVACCCVLLWNAKRGREECGTAPPPRNW